MCGVSVLEEGYASSIVALENSNDLNFALSVTLEIRPNVT
jgi:hypothetical protein